MSGYVKYPHMRVMGGNYRSIRGYYRILQDTTHAPGLRTGKFKLGTFSPRVSVCDFQSVTGNLAFEFKRPGDHGHRRPDASPVTHFGAL